MQLIILSGLIGSGLAAPGLLGLGNHHGHSASTTPVLSTTSWPAFLPRYGYTSSSTSSSTSASTKTSSTTSTASSTTTASTLRVLVSTTSSIQPLYVLITTTASPTTTTSTTCTSSSTTTASSTRTTSSSTTASSSTTTSSSTTASSSSTASSSTTASSSSTSSTSATVSRLTTASPTTISSSTSYWISSWTTSSWTTSTKSHHAKHTDVEHTDSKHTDAKHTDADQYPSYGSVVDDVDSAPNPVTKPGKLPHRADGKMNLAGSYTDRSKTAAKGDYGLTSPNQYLNISGIGYFSVDWEVTDSKKSKESSDQIVMPVWSNLKGKLHHVASGGSKRMDDHKSKKDASCSTTDTYMGCVGSSLVTLPAGTQQMWQTEYYWLNGSVTLTNTQNVDDYSLGVASKSHKDVEDDINTPVDDNTDNIRYGVVRDTGDDTAPVPQYCTNAEYDPTDMAGLTNVGQQSKVSYVDPNVAQASQVVARATNNADSVVSQVQAQAAQITDAANQVVAQAKAGLPL